MKVKAAEAVEAQAVAAEGAKDVRIRWLIHGPDGAANFHLRQFELAPGGHTPRHQHAWEHEVYVLSGGGVVRSTGGDQPVAAGQCVFIAPNEQHQFINTGEGPMKFLCLVPKSAR